MSGPAPSEDAEQAALRAGFLAGQDRLAEAEQEYRAAVALQPGRADWLHALGIVRARRGQVADAVPWFRAALEHRPDWIEAQQDLAVSLQQAGSEDALPAFRRLAKLAPGRLEAWLGLGNALIGHGQEDEAIACYRRALQQDPDYAPALMNLAALHVQRGELPEALQACEQVLRLRPHAAEAHFNAGTVLRKLQRTEAAEQRLRAALAIDPGHVSAWHNLGNVLGEQDRFEDAAACFERAIALQPGSAAAYNNLGHALREQGRADAAIAAFEQASALQPDDPRIRFALCIAQLPIAYRSEAEIEQRRAAYAARLEQLHDDVLASAAPAGWASGVGCIQPFYLPYQGRDDLALQTLYGETVCRIMAAAHPQAALASRPSAGERIRVGFVSGFFRGHSNWKIPIRGWMGQLDRSRFAVTAYHTGSRQDIDTDLARTLCERFVQGPLSPERWRQEILADRPHVLIYPELGMDPVAVQLAAQRLAPIQCNSWGQPVTSGLPTVDYFLSSALMEPPDAAAHYSEKLVALPNLSIHYEPYRPMPDAPVLRRAELGLRDGAVVYWCGQAPWKFLPGDDHILAEIARDISDCQFAFIEFQNKPALNVLFHDRMRDAFAAQGLRAEDHIVVMPHLRKDRFIASFALADVFLDSLGWSGCNTMLESLTHDLPILSWGGPFMRGRHGIAILTMLGIPETIAADRAQYHQLAVRLGRDAAWRQELRTRTGAAKHRLYHDRSVVTALEEFLAGAVAAL